ncbi:hydroxymethylbilane synthase [Wohlfahrtiimonas chitiniclastica]|uniref:hydroxymethylbilane synthase n=1 Tax=Wohlfahrtiimonas chitiniclastica TaxID=400946 RepID=UPI000B994FF9|nr:hydroxymethylbilane synthase [Wohlfahrtiimonas chitiniclastica]OYQ85269.1 hydroxymethylbilane synthase [Wohlfahrtiimonas chitiniclastica]OYQ86498.1 hydroxymethylbilane synthase [Wohlfahrtiimonas chitiniclastica]
MSLKTLTIATRESPLALWQAEHVKSKILEFFPEMDVQLLGMTTKGDQMLSSPLSKIGGKGLFIKELEVALLDGRADIAVHSMKDVPMAKELPEDLIVPVVMKREDPRDALVSNHNYTIKTLPQNAVVGSCSLRRRVQLMALRPDLQLKDLRGNINTRLAKLDAGEFDAIILATAGLKRLGFDHRISEEISQDISLPAVGQGAIGIECNRHNEAVRKIISLLNDDDTAVCVAAERAFNSTLNGGCQAPIAGYAELTEKGLWIRGLVGNIDTNEIIYAEMVGDPLDAQNLGHRLAEELLSKGADEFLRSIYGEKK